MKTSLFCAAILIAAGCTRNNGLYSSCAAGNLCAPEVVDLSTGGAAPDLARADLASGGGGHHDAGGDMSLPSLAGNKVDVLFMVDNSPSMDAMQTELKHRFAAFMTTLAGLGTPLDLHLGVVTSDYGAGSTPNLSGGCDKSPGGQKGVLQARAAPGTPEAMAGCSGPLGTPFIHYAIDPSGKVTTNLPGGGTDTTTLTETFTCMASVGSNGCGFEHQLESVYAALHNVVENAGFLRPDALLVVVFVTNEDDGSAPPTTDVFNPDPAKRAPPPAGYGAIDTYRQTDFGVACQIGGMLRLTPYGDSGGPLAGCIGAPNNNAVMSGAEHDVSRYINLFTLPASQGCAKVDPRNVVVAAIDAPESPLAIVQVAANTGTGKGKLGQGADYSPCPAPNTVDGINCLVRVQHSCQNRVQPGFFGDPSVRLNTVVRAVASSQVTDICGDNLDAPPDYSAALKSLAMLIKARLH